MPPADLNGKPPAHFAPPTNKLIIAGVQYPQTAFGLHYLPHAVIITFYQSSAGHDARPPGAAGHLKPRVEFSEDVSSGMGQNTSAASSFVKTSQAEWAGTPRAHRVL